MTTTRKFICLENAFDLSAGSAARICKYAENYLAAYPALVALANCQSMNAAHHQTVLLLATYGWMPTVPKSMVDVLFAERVRAMQSLDEAMTFIDDLSSGLINNSWVGSSKVLHFLKPELFPIWDSRVAKAIGLSGNSHCMSSKPRYMDYVWEMNRSPKNTIEATSEIAERVETAFGYKPTPLRCLELDLFCKPKIAER
ncbi:hypothetical protein ACFQ14_01155 [Pseudahrensia aquimaris]|uniref:Uncharacterized protein n=1 Tax=Pseudahrensia aquimaris TaxID=744461 RepID=A0ABW3F966_9HYPH